MVLQTNSSMVGPRAETTQGLRRDDGSVSRDDGSDVLDGTNDGWDDGRKVGQSENDG